ncbi:hypothetical protein LTR70_001750 [Exophiala xenobiotica]|uniref:Uncharacterized protein n=1 Tax=Lithohypha guttulata TaxID=1690604 RepID=A0ABR0KM36_9EURO|nr:hypothetical protein LTR24_001057 [Lithohypha guttulata]KAK5327008.1 hypothetical protein LTR70_001750 [Exophiala xenobiotica]
MSPYGITTIELCYIISVIGIGTVAINLAIALIWNKVSNQQRIALHGHWEYQTDNEETEEAARQAAEVRRYKSLLTTTFERGLLHDLDTRASFVDGKLSDSDMIIAVARMMREIRLKFDEIAYLGKHTSKGREDDACLYARYRLHGMTKCIRKTASLRRGRHVGHIMVSLTPTDAALVQEKGWGAPSSKSSLGRLATLVSVAKTTEMVMPLPRNSKELRAVVQPVLESDVCSVAGVEPCA